MAPVDGVGSSPYASVSGWVPSVDS